MSRHVWWHSERSIQSSSHSQATLCISSMVGLRLYIRHTTYRGIHPPRGQARLLWHRWSHCSATYRCCWWNTVPNSEVQSTFFITCSRTPSATATLFGPSNITLYLKQKLMTAILLLDNCLETSIDILVLFLLHSYTVKVCNQSRYARLKLKLLIGWLIVID